MAMNPFALVRQVFAGGRGQGESGVIASMSRDLSRVEPLEIMNALQSKPANPQSLSLQFIGSNNAGVRVTPEIAFQVSAVWACIDVIASAMSSSAWNVYEWLAKDDHEFLFDDALQWVLNTRWNTEMTAQSGKRAVMIAAVSWGNGYAEIVRDLSGRVVELWPISPERVEPMRPIGGGPMFYRVYNELGGWVDLESRDVLHIKGAGISGLMGDNVIAKAVRSIALTIALERFGESYFGNNTQMGGWLGVPKELGEAAYTRMKASLEEGRKGVNRAFRMGIFEGGATWHPEETNADDAQLIPARQQQVEEICRWFRVPPHKVAHLLRATNNNIEHQGLEFSRDTLRPWKIEIEQEGEYKLFSRRGKPRFISIDITWASQGDFKSRMEGYQIGRAMGVYSANDILKKEGENTIGPAGDIRIVQGAMIRLEDVGAAYTKQPAAPAETEPAPVAQAWLQSVYARIQRRVDNRAFDLEKAGHKDWQTQARDAALPYAKEQLEELAAVLGERQPVAHSWAIEVINGCTPEVAAAVVFERGTA